MTIQKTCDSVQDMENKKPLDAQQGKARITITLKQDLLPLLDNFIDGERIRNRSHAIEYILGQHLGIGLQQAVIFAGTDNDGTIHALTQVKNRSIIAYQFDMLKEFGIRNVLLVIDENGGPLKKYLGDGEQWKMHITYVHDTERKGTAHALKLTQPLIEHTFVLLYSDVLADVNLSDMVEYHTNTGSAATIALTYKRDAGNYGVARMEGNSIVEFDEKPGESGRHGLVNAGMYVFEPTIFDFIGKGTHSLEKDILPKMAKNNVLTGYPFQSRWFDISTQKGVKNAEDDWID